MTKWPKIVEENKCDVKLKSWSAVKQSLTKALKTYLTTLPDSFSKQWGVYPSQKVLFNLSIIVKFNTGKIVVPLTCYWSHIGT